MSAKKGSEKKEFVIASFDIGVRNMAFCVMKFNPDDEDGKKFPIICWKDMDLIDDNEIDYEKCVGVLKKKGGGICGKSSRMKSDDNKFYCMMHNPDKKKYKAYEKRKVNTISRKEMCIALIKTLDRFPILLNGVDRVIIEQQFKMNPRMITLSNMLYSYFVMKGVMINDIRLNDVVFISSRNKYKIYDGPFLKSNLKNPKAQRKALAVEYCKYIIRKDEKNLEFITNYNKKKDDIADCFLQGAYYLNNIHQKSLKKKRPRKKKATKKMSIMEAFKVV